MVVHGAVWSEANDFAVKLASQEGAALIHPFDDPEVRSRVFILVLIEGQRQIWTGHTSIVKEISQQLQTPPSAVLCTASTNLWPSRDILVDMCHRSVVAD